jgi:hypothetical protein
VSGCEKEKPRKKSVVKHKGVAEDRFAFIRESLPLLLSTRQRQNDLRDQTHRELVNRPSKFNKRSQRFVCAHDETLSVTMHVDNPDRSPFGING